MLSTTIFVAFMLGLVLGSLALWILFLRLGLWWAKADDITWRRLAVATGLVIVVQIVVNAVFLLVPTNSEAADLGVAVVTFAVVVGGSCLVIARIFKIRFLRALQAWLLTLVPAIALALFVFLVFRPFLFQAFISPTNAMAPTLRGQHWRSVCTECGQPSLCSAMEIEYSPPEQRMICENFHVTHNKPIDYQVYAADRFLVAKFLTPKRWDVVVFRYPGDPSVLYCMRLVGLPGETVHIEGGAVWIDGKRLTPPDSLRGIEYLSEIPEQRGEIWGSKDHPAVLDAGEYFVLGDFSPQSMDSRVWERGAPGHHPYAVPESHLLGVVTHNYWPPARWRVLR